MRDRRKTEIGRTRNSGKEIRERDREKARERERERNK